MNGRKERRSSPLSLDCSLNRKKTVHLKTDGNPGLKASISSLWSPKELVNLVPVDLELEVEMDKSSVGRDPEQAK